MIIVCNKPYGVLSQFTPEPGSAWDTLAGLGLPKDVYPVGRLDADSEGMLVLSDERNLVAKLLEPERAHPRKYWVQVEGTIDSNALNTLQQGVEIHGRMTKPCNAMFLREPLDIPERTPPIRVRRTVPTSWIALELTEGRNRQVRKMTAAVGYPTLRLMRVRIGGLDLGSLNIAVGSWCILNDRQRLQLLERPQ